MFASSSSSSIWSTASRRDVADLGVEPVHAVDRASSIASRDGDDEPHVGAGDRADVVDGEDVRRIGHGHDERRALPGDRQRLVATRHERREIVDAAVGSTWLVVEVDELEAGLLGERARRGRASVTAPCATRTRPSDRPVRACSTIGLVELLLGDEPALQEDRAQRHLCRHRPVLSVRIAPELEGPRD